MVANKTSRFAFDWWIIQKRFVYLIIAIFALCILVAGAAVYVWKYGNPLRNVAVVNHPAGARFVSFEGDVRVIRAATRETIPANADTELYPGDTVQTQANGRARIGLADGSTLLIKPNSTIIVRDNARADDGKKTNVHVKVDSGQLSVRTEQQADGTTNVVETPKTKNTMGEKTNASFGVNPEGTEEIRVATGVIETTNGTGDKASIRRGRIRFGKQFRAHLGGAEIIGSAATHQTSRSRTGRGWTKRSRERRLEVAASAIRHTCLLSS